MVLLESRKLSLRTKMPPFSLKDTAGKIHHSNLLFGKKGILVVFACNHCPYAQAVWERIIELAENIKPLKVNVVAINPNINPDYPKDSTEEMKKLIKVLEIKFPYLVDESQEVAKKFKAQCTPDLYLFNSKQELVYHGRIDDNWKEPEKVTNHELLAAINAMTNNLPLPEEEQKPCIGCSIKWRD